MNTNLEAVSVGDIMCASWGYDQTNIDYFAVVKTTAKTVTLQPVESAITERTDLYGEYRVPTRTPKTGVWTDQGYQKDMPVPTIRRTLHGVANNDPYVKVNDFMYAHLWDGMPKHATHTH